MAEKKVDMDVTGMHCATCAITIEKELTQVKGVSKASVQYGTGQVSVSYDPKSVDIKKLENAVKKAGYGIVYQKVIVSIGGMHCATCVDTIQKALRGVEGISSAEVNLGTEEARITFNPAIVSMDVIKSTILDAGYQFRGTSQKNSLSDDEDAKKELNDTLRRTILGFIVSGFLMGLMWYGGMAHPTMGFVQFIIATPVFVYLALPIWKSAVHALSLKVLNMDVMYSMGITVAYLASLLSTFMIVTDFHYIIYDTAIMLTSFLTLGRYLEARAKGHTTGAIRRLMDLTPTEASVIREGGEVRIPVSEVRTGDRIVIRPGERVPVDSVIESGSSYIDESMVTGESIAVKKQAHDEVIGGTINGSGLLTCTVMHVGEEMLLSRIISLVHDAQGAKPSVQRIADTAVSWFIPVVLAIAIIASLTWYLLLGETAEFSLSVFIAILVVACPCALGLATPTAITVGVGRGATLGLLIRNGESLEIADRLTTVFFDKTGTLTRGKPEVAFMYADSVTEMALLSLAASLEGGSEHPLGTAIIKKAHDSGITPVPVTNFVAIPGKGITGDVLGTTAHVGNLAMMEDAGIVVPSSIAERIALYESKGSTPVLVAQNSILVGVLAIVDTIKPDTKSVISTLTKLGLKTGMLTGDTQKAASAIAEMIGITNVMAGIRPDQKEHEIHRLQDEGEIVVFVGDGINDSPALARADIGIALGSGTDIAMESADIVLVHDNLLYVVAAIELARKVMGRIRMNIFWAFAYNAILIPLAAGILYPLYGIMFRPEYGALAMAFSSVTVVSLSLLLMQYTPPALALASDHHLSGGNEREEHHFNRRKRPSYPDTAIDPVCGMDVITTDAPYTTAYQGTTYYFCAPGCKAAFKAEPSRFIAKK